MRDNKNWPIQVAVAPSRMKVMENPTMNMIEFTNTARERDESFSFAFNWSNEEPEMMEMYPGTNGRTHGDKNEIKPAPNAQKMEMLSIGRVSLPYIYLDLALIVGKFSKEKIPTAPRLHLQRAQST